MRPPRRPGRFGRLAAVIGLVLSVGAAGIVTTTLPLGTASADEGLGAGGEYHPLTPVRVLDTRTGFNDDPAKPGVKQIAPDNGAPGNLFTIQVLGGGGVPLGQPNGLPASATDVLAIAVNVTVVGPTVAGHLRIWGSGEAEGGSSLVNFNPGQVVPNSAIIRAGADGRVNVRLLSGGNVGSAHVLIDVFGWFATNTAQADVVNGDGVAELARGARLIPLDVPARLYDSRPVNQPLGPDGVLTLPIRGADAIDPVRADVVPNDPAVTGVLVNITGVNARPGSRPTHISAVPQLAPGTEPSTSNLNLVPNQVKANLALLPVGPDGAVRFFNKAGQTDIVIDAVAYLRTGDSVSNRTGRVVPLTSPFRVFDTRLPAFGDTPLPPGKAEDWSFQSFVNDVKIDGVPLDKQSALIGNLTATNLQRPFGWYTPVATHMTAYPTPPDGGGGAPPTVSNLNLGEGMSVPNMALLRYGGAATADPYQVRFHNFNGFVDYLFDATAVVLAD